jgi:hypothetical protein
VVLGEVREADTITNQCSLRSRPKPLPQCPTRP